MSPLRLRTRAALISLHLSEIFHTESPAIAHPRYSQRRGLPYRLTHPRSLHPHGSPRRLLQIHAGPIKPTANTVSCPVLAGTRPRAQRRHTRGSVPTDGQRAGPGNSRHVGWGSQKWGALTPFLRGPKIRGLLPRLFRHDTRDPHS